MDGWIKKTLKKRQKWLINYIYFHDDFTKKPKHFQTQQEVKETKYLQ